MKEVFFNEWTESIKQAGEIRNKELEASRIWSITTGNKDEKNRKTFLSSSQKQT